MAAQWSPAALATLAALAETFVRGGALRRAELAAAAIDALDPEQRRQFCLVFRLVESRPANLLLGWQLARFSDMVVDRREVYFCRWVLSRLPLRRSAFQAYKKLLCFLAYADPGDAVPNARWSAIGYEPPLEPLTGQPTPIEPWTPPTARPSEGGEVSIEADVVVVGSGAGGGVVAADLARAGRSVVVLEAGAFVPEPAMPTDELSAYDRLYLDHGLTSTWDGSISILAGSIVGGGTTINWMTCIACLFFPRDILHAAALIRQPRVYEQPIAQSVQIHENDRRQGVILGTGDKQPLSTSADRPRQVQAGRCLGPAG